MVSIHMYVTVCMYWCVHVCVYMLVGVHAYGVQVFKYMFVSIHVYGVYDVCVHAHRHVRACVLMCTCVHVAGTTLLWKFFSKSAKSEGTGNVEALT